jgi:A/G-specific adenine glycosylase
MNPRDIGTLRRRLIAWYKTNRRRLPWRRTRDPYRIWVSEVMLQQTQVSTVIPYYRRFLQRFPDVASLAEAELEEVLKLWEGLGYYARARNLYRAAGIVAGSGGGRVPRDIEAFRRLPGVGDYIGAAVQSIAFDRPLAVVDGNVKRVLSRLFAMEEPVNSSAAARAFREAAAALLDPRRPGTFNQAMMELGALVCSPRSPACDRCPVSHFCAARRSGRQGSYPRRNPGRALPTVAIAVGVVYKNGRVLITQRPAEGLLGGLWEFPGGKLQQDESPQAACERELMEEVGLRVEVERRLARVRHAYSHFRIVMDVFVCRFRAGRVRRSGPAAHRWVKPAVLGRYPFPKANHKFMGLLTAEPRAAPAGPAGKRP